MAIFYKNNTVLILIEGGGKGEVEGEKEERKEERKERRRRGRGRVRWPRSATFDV